MGPERVQGATAATQSVVVKDQASKGVVISAYVLAFLIPPVGFIMGLVLMFKRRVGHGWGVVALAVFGWILAFVILAGVGGSAEAQASGPRAEATARAPYLSPSMAKRFMRQELTVEFDSFRYADPVINRCDRRSRSRMRCNVGWWIGDSSFRGRITIWLYRARGGVYYDRAYRIVHTDDYCKFVTFGANCSTVYRVR